MKKFIILIICLLSIISCNTDKKQIKNLQNTVFTLQDSICVLNAKNEYYKKVIEDYKYKYDYKVDSVLLINDSLITELKLRDFQLARIQYYNNIAAKNNNIKFLRGWINRIFN